MTEFGEVWYSSLSCSRVGEWQSEEDGRSAVSCLWGAEFHKKFVLPEYQRRLAAEKQGGGHDWESRRWLQDPRRVDGRS